MAACTGVVFVTLLCQPGDILDFWPVLVSKFTTNEKIEKVLFACENCVSGQLALWGGGLYLWHANQYHPLAHFCAVVLSILFARLIAVIIKLLNEYAS